MQSANRYGLVTGAGSGIGRAICLRLARQGWHIAVADIDTAAAQETSRLIDEAGGHGLPVELDVRHSAAWADLHDRLRSEWPALDLLVNNAGVTAASLFERTSPETWDWVQEINLGGAVLGCRTMLPWLRATPRLANEPRKSCVMNVSSAAGVLTGPRKSAYNVSKAALVALSETLHHELKPHGVSVTAVCPWYVPTRLVSRGRFDRTAEKAFTARVTRQSKLTVDDVAREALAATFRGRAVCVIGGKAKALYAFKRFAPNLYARVVGKLYERATDPGSEEIVPLTNENRTARAA